MNIDGQKITINKTAKETFYFFVNMKNYEQIMPNSVQKFEADQGSFLFALKGMPEIRLVLGKKIKYSLVSLGSASNNLSFTLSTHISEVSDSACDVQLSFEGNFNPMMTMMVKKPLTTFIDTLTENIAKLYQG